MKLKQGERRDLLRRRPSELPSFELGASSIFKRQVNSSIQNCVWVNFFKKKNLADFESGHFSLHAYVQLKCFFLAKIEENLPDYLNFATVA